VAPGKKLRLFMGHIRGQLSLKIPLGVASPTGRLHQLLARPLGFGN
jgi:hypothetical protein